ncbi:MAG: DUF1800 domain-containing protein [Planctomycetota bacterium]
MRSASIWTEYAPSASEPWNLRRVVHLHRRAGFGACAAELERDLGDGPGATLTRFLEGKRTVGAPASFTTTSQLLSDGAVAGNDPARLKAWWLWRMLVSPDPLGERLALLWHDHFATSQLKVMDLAAMLRQNELLRRHGRAPFAELCRNVVKDAALLVWLDAQSNRKEHPNENLARELMELFTLGEGNYGERDVKEVARALTGLSVSAEQRVHFAAKNHDDGEKTILGRTERFDADGVLAHLVAQPATATHLARRLCALFLREELASAEVVASLAAELRAHELDLGHAVALVLRSRLFFSAANLGGVVAAPVPWLIGAARALELLDPAPRTLLLAEWSARLGQDLFYPPTVFGWDGGRAWITTGALLGRARFAQELVGGALTPVGVDPLAALRRRGAPERELARVLLGDESFAAGSGDPAQLVARLLASPAAQLA